MSFSPLATRIRLPALPTGTRRVYLVFNPTRAKLIQPPTGQLVPRHLLLDAVDWAVGIRSAPRVGAFGGRPSDWFPHVMVLDVAPGAAETDQDLTVESLEERPELALCIADQIDTSTIITSTSDSGCLDTASLKGTNVTTAAGTIVPDVQLYLDEVDAKIATLADADTQAFSRFFFELDRRSEDKLRAQFLASTSPLIPAVDAVHGTVVACMRNRVQVRKSPPGQCVAGYFPIGPNLKTVTELFFDLVDTHLFGGGAFVLAKFEDAFERFARGDLRLRTASGFWSTQPSSGWYFLFAELALFGGLESGPALTDLTAEQRARWREVANVLVRTQEHFALAYDPQNVALPACAPPERVAAPFPEDYCGCALDTSAVGAPQITATRNKYAPMTFAGLAEQSAINAENAFPGWAAEIPPCT